MKILTIGAGVIGVTCSWQLQKPGYDLTHLVRKHKIDQYKAQGIQMRCLDLRKAGGGRTGNVIDTVIFGLALADTVIGDVDGEITPRLKTLHHMFQKANLNPRLTADIIPYIRTHYVWGACCVAAYLIAGAYDRFCQAGNIKESYLAMREGWEICIKQGLNPRKVTPIL
jgi:ketopantoate reductase